MTTAAELREALEMGPWNRNKWEEVIEDAARTIALPILERDEGLVDSRDVVDPFVAETLYEEHIVHNIAARGGMAVESDWHSWDELPDAARNYWMSLAVAARLAGIAALKTISTPTPGAE